MFFGHAPDCHREVKQMCRRQMRLFNSSNSPQKLKSVDDSEDEKAERKCEDVFLRLRYDPPQMFHSLCGFWVRSWSRSIEETSRWVWDRTGQKTGSPLVSVEENRPRSAWTASCRRQLQSKANVKLILMNAWLVLWLKAAVFLWLNKRCSVLVVLWIFSPAVSNIDIFKVLYRSNTSVNAARWRNARLKPFTTDDSSLLDLIIKLNSCECLVCENNLNTAHESLPQQRWSDNL